MLVVGRVRLGAGELHRDAEPVAVLRARLAEDLERLDARDRGELLGRGEEVRLLGRSGGVPGREDDRVADAVFGRASRCVPPLDPAEDTSEASRLATSWPERNRSTNGSAARMPPASGSYSACPLSGLTQTTANAWRASRSISRPASSASPRSQPSERMSDDRAARQRAAAPHVVVGLQRRADAGAARPVLHARRRGLERRLGIAGAELRRQPGQPRAERERLDAASRAARRVQVEQQRPRVRLHRSGDVESTTSLRGAVLRLRNVRADGSPPVASDARTSPRTSSARPLRSGRSRRERRCGRATRDRLR